MLGGTGKSSVAGPKRAKEGGRDTTCKEPKKKTNPANQPRKQDILRARAGREKDKKPNVKMKPPEHQVHPKTP